MNQSEINNNNNEVWKTREDHLRALTHSYVGIEKPLKGVAACESLQDLITQLHSIFESNFVNIEYVHHLMLSYKSNPKDWKKFAKFDRYRYVFYVKTKTSHFLSLKNKENTPLILTVTTS